VVNQAGRGRSTMDQWRRGPRVPERGGTLTRVRPPTAPVHQRIAGGTKERGAREARLGPHRSSDGGVEARRRQWREEVMGNSMGRVFGRREGLGELCGATGVVEVAFIGPGEGVGGWPE
jgi:hypothetical protein